MNQKHGIPTVSGGTPFSFSRGKFLDGTIRTFYAPGQKPTLFNSYVPPTDWPKAGTLLRVPQVCWLNLYFALAPFGPKLTQTWQMFYGDTRHSTAIAFFDFRHVPPKPFYFGEGPFTTETANQDYEESTRLTEVFDEAKARIEAIRPGRTWVEVIDWSTPAYGVGFNKDSNGFLQFPAPHSTDKPFFGTNFLNLWAGVGLYDDGGLRGTFNPYVPEGRPLGDPFLARPYARLEGARPSFAGYSSKLYHPGNGSSWHAPAVSPAVFGGTDGVNAIAPAYNPYEVTIPQTYVYAGDLFDFFESQAGALGVGHTGDSSALTSDSVVALIADHYGFDPDTGKDVG